MNTLHTLSVILAGLVLNLLVSGASAQTVVVYVDSSDSMDGPTYSQSDPSKLSVAREVLAGIRGQVSVPMFIIPWNDEPQEGFMLLQSDQDEIKATLSSAIASGTGTTNLHVALSGVPEQAQCIVYMVVTDLAPGWETETRREMRKMINHSSVGVFVVLNKSSMTAFDFYRPISDKKHYEVERLTVNAGTAFINRALKRLNQKDCPTS